MTEFKVEDLILSCRVTKRKVKSPRKNILRADRYAALLRSSTYFEMQCMHRSGTKGFVMV
jgi:hypothetical protein